MFYIKDHVNFSAYATTISSIFPEVATDVIANAFESYFWADERSDFWEYSLEGCEETIKDIMACFIAEQCNDTKQAAELALTLSMPLMNGSYSEVYPAGSLF
jgi:hypothetical protein